jgi:hypothetical protein
MFVGTGKPRKPQQRAEARRLRREFGWSYKKIAARVGVSANSIFNWTRDVPITEEQRRRNLAHMTPESEIAKRRGEMWRVINRVRRLEYQAEGRLRARAGDPLHQAGCMLYWAEGAKDRNTLVFANSDTAMMKFFLRFLRESLEVTDERVALRLNVYLRNGLSIDRVENHWLTALGLPRSCLGKHTIDHFPTSTSGRRRHKLPYGVCFLRVRRSTNLVQHVYGAIQEYAGFEEPLWLDGTPRNQGRRS